MVVQFMSAACDVISWHMRQYRGMEFLWDAHLRDALEKNEQEIIEAPLSILWQMLSLLH